jgi:hypothetical protein
VDAHSNVGGGEFKAKLRRGGLETVQRERRVSEEE